MKRSNGKQTGKDCNLWASERNERTLRPIWGYELLWVSLTIATDLPINVRKYAIFYDYFKILTRLKCIFTFLSSWGLFLCLFSLVCLSSNCIKELLLFSMSKFQLPPFPGIKRLKVLIPFKSLSRNLFPTTSAPSFSVHGIQGASITAPIFLSPKLYFSWNSTGSTIPRTHNLSTKTFRRRHAYAERLSVNAWTIWKIGQMQLSFLSYSDSTMDSPEAHTLKSALWNRVCVSKFHPCSNLARRDLVHSNAYPKRFILVNLFVADASSTLIALFLLPQMIAVDC